MTFPSCCQVRTALTGAVFNKMLRLTSGTSKGTLIMLTSTDIKRLQSVAYNVFGFVGAPTAIVASLTVCFLYLGVAGVPVLAVAALLAPAVWKTTHMFDNWSEGVTKFQQKRMQQLTEALQSIALVKSFSWEEFVHRTIGETRLQELKVCQCCSYSHVACRRFTQSWWWRWAVRSCCQLRHCNHYDGCLELGSDLERVWLCSSRVGASAAALSVAMLAAANTSVCVVWVVSLVDTWTRPPHSLCCWCWVRWSGLFCTFQTRLASCLPLAFLCPVSASFCNLEKFSLYRSSMSAERAM